MTMDEALDAFADKQSYPPEAIQWVLDEWVTTAPRCRALLHDYVTGIDLSERTEQAVEIISYLLGEKADTASFPDLCRLGLDADRCDSVFSELGAADCLPPILISTFDGDRTPLQRLVETPGVDELLRGDVLLALAYLARTSRFPEADMYEYLADLPDRLLPQDQAYVWFGWVRAVAALGFAGLATRVEKLFQQGRIDPTLMGPEHFWEDLRESQADPHGTSARVWQDIGPMGSTIEWLRLGAEEADGWRSPAPEPIRNPLRNIGRNDPCPCGSGKKYKKCCLAA